MTIRVFSGVLLMALALPLAALDVTPPVVAPTVSGPLGSNGWYVGDVTVTWSVSDAESGIASTSGCGTSVLTQDDAVRVYQCVAVSEGGVTSESVSVSRDASPPSVAFLDNAGTYTVDRTISIACNVTDVTSGVATTDCTAIYGNAYDFTIGSNAYTYTATDYAGNSGAGTAAFDVVVDVAGMSVLVDRWVAKESLARSLKRKLEAGHVDQFNRTLDRESGKNISASDAETLKRLAAYL